jgi:hypothetical protein
MRKQINLEGFEELDWEDVLEEDLKAGDIIGVATNDNEGEENADEVAWKFYYVSSVDENDVILVSKFPSLEDPFQLNADGDFYLHISFLETRETWSPGNRNLHDIPIETVIKEVFDLGKREMNWNRRTVQSIAEETGLQSQRIRQSLERHPAMFRRTQSGSWELTPPRAAPQQPANAPAQPAGGAPVERPRRRRGIRYQ